jgi:hypothetical protein
MKNFGMVGPIIHWRLISATFFDERVSTLRRWGEPAREWVGLQPLFNLGVRHGSRAAFVRGGSADYANIADYFHFRVVRSHLANPGGAFSYFLATLFASPFARERVG